MGRGAARRPSGSLSDLTAGLIGGSSALASHAVRAGTRMAVNTSPEPFSNVIVSLADLTPGC
jgi:hypothetical protein